MSRLNDYRMMKDMASRRGYGRRDYRMDGRNPYGSRGGYVVSDRRSSRDYQMKSPDYNDTEYDSRYDYNDYGGEYAGSDMGYSRELTGYYGDTPFQVNRNYDMAYGRDYARGREYARGRDYGIDYAEDGEYLKQFTKDLMKEIDNKEAFSHDKIIKKAKEVGVTFDHFTEEEFYATVLMMVTDHEKTFGTPNLETYVRMAKEWLCDEDSVLKYGDKLEAYYHFVIKGE